jgi:hypothetical protein
MTERIRVEALPSGNYKVVVGLTTWVIDEDEAMRCALDPRAAADLLRRMTR